MFALEGILKIPFSDRQERGDAVLEVLAERVGLSSSVAGEPICKVHEGPAARPGDLGTAREAVEKTRNKRVKVYVDLDGARAVVADTAQGIGSRISDMHDLVFHHGDHDGQGLADKGHESFVLWAIHDGAKSRDGSVTVVPVLTTQVLLDELEDGTDKLGLYGLSIELQGLVGSAGNVVIIVTGIFILSGH